MEDVPKKMCFYLKKKIKKIRYFKMKKKYHSPKKTNICYSLFRDEREDDLHWNMGGNEHDNRENRGHTVGTMLLSKICVNGKAKYVRIAFL
jgi:hypothetical protein